MSSAIVKTPSNFYSGFDPRMISGCQLWLDGADPNAFTFSSGTSISTWKDKSSNGLIGTALNSPTQTANSINGLPAVVFSTGTQYINFGNNLNIGTNSIYVFSVVKYDSTANGAIIGKSRLAALAGRWTLVRDTTSGGMAMIVDATGTGINSAYADTSTTPQLISGYWDRSIVYIHQNGTLRNNVALSNASNLSTSDSLFVGAYQNSTGGAPPASGLYFNGKIGEIIVYIGTTLTIPQRQQIEGYLAWKWGLQNSLQSTHIYRQISVPTRPFQPVDIDTCAFWIDASDASTVTSNVNSIVSQVRDKSGNGFNISRGGTPSTGFVWNGSTKFNSTYPSFFYNGAQNLTLGSNNSTSISFTSTTAVFIVLQRVGNAEFQSVFDSTSTGRIFGFYHVITPTTPNYRIFNGTTLAPASNNATTNPVIYSNIFGGASNSSIFENGTQTVTGSAGNNAVTGIVVGSRFNLNTETFQGHIAEVIYLNDANLNSTSNIPTRHRVEGYLAWKWGLVQFLPSTHPFKLYPPMTAIFNPSQLPFCQLWYDAADTSTIVSSGSTVTSWSNKAGTTVNITTNGLAATTGNISSTRLNYINVPFGGALRFTASLNTQARTWFFVVRNNTPSTDWTFMQLLHPSSGTTGQDQIYINRSGSTYTMFQQPFNTVRMSAVVSNPIGVVNVYTLVNGSVTSSNAINTTGTINTLSTSTVASGYSTASLLYSINLPSTTNYRTSLDVFEVLFYSRPLTIAERMRVEGYLAWKWGVQTNLPTSPRVHAYSKFRP